MYFFFFYFFGLSEEFFCVFILKSTVDSLVPTAIKLSITGNQIHFTWNISEKS